MDKEKNLGDLLDIILLLMMLVEKMEYYKVDNTFNIPQIQKVLKNSLKVLTPVAEGNYLKIYEIDESITQSLMIEYGKLISILSPIDFANKMILGQMMEAFSIDPKTMEATTHRVLRKRK